MSLLRPDLIALHRLDTSEEIYLRAAAVTMMEPNDSNLPDGPALVYLGERIRLVQESAKEVRKLVERAV